MAVNPATQEANKSVLDRVTSALSNWEDYKKHLSREISNSDALKILDACRLDRGYLDELIADLRLFEAADTGRFFVFLGRAARMMEWGNDGHSLLGATWARLYEKSADLTQKSLLSGFFDSYDFFSSLYCVPEFIAQADLSPVALADWLPRIRSRLGDDMASSGLWNGIESLADNHPDSALVVLRMWTEQRPSDHVTSMAVSLLGKLRSKHPSKTETIDHQLSSHADDQLRIVFYRSWVIYDQQTTIKAEDYQKLIECMAAGTPAEIGEAFHFTRCTLSAKHRCDGSFRFGIHWLAINAPTHPDGVWAHWMINLAPSCDGRAHSMDLPLCRDAIPQLLPIPAGHDGTWLELETLLEKLLLEDRVAFDRLLFEIARRDRSNLAEKFSPHGGFHRLPTLLSQHSPEMTITQALDSLDESVRHFGLKLFCHLGLERLPYDSLERWTDDWMATLVCQVKRESFIDSGGSRFLMAFVERVSQSSENLKTFFVEELIWQMKNLPGACLEPAKIEAANLSSDSLLHRAVNVAEQYFEKLKSCHRSAINSMEVSGYRRAQRLENRKRSRQISESTEKNSPLLSMISKSYTLYGEMQWQTYMGGNLAPPSTMQEFSHSFEFPRLFALDPDGNAQRYRHATRLMTDLVAVERERRDSDDDS